MPWISVIRKVFSCGIVLQISQLILQLLRYADEQQDKLISKNIFFKPKRDLNLLSNPDYYPKL